MVCPIHTFIIFIPLHNDMVAKGGGEAQIMLQGGDIATSLVVCDKDVQLNFAVAWPLVDSCLQWLHNLVDTECSNDNWNVFSGKLYGDMSFMNNYHLGTD